MENSSPDNLLSDLSDWFNHQSSHTCRAIVSRIALRVLPVVFEVGEQPEPDLFGPWDERRKNYVLQCCRAALTLRCAALAIEPEEQLRHHLTRAAHSVSEA